MDENMEEQVNKGMESLEEFYAQKKNEQDALRRLLEALENKSKNESTDLESNKNQK
jgi:hypothetical protein